MSGVQDRLLNFLLGWALLTAALPTLIVYRAAMQPRYQWGLFGIVGEGVTPGLLVIAAAAILAWSAVVLGSVRTHAGGLLLIGLNALWFTSILVAALRLGSQMTLRGDAYGIRINLAILGPLVFGALLLLSIRWWWTRRQNLVGFEALSTLKVTLTSGARRVLCVAAVALLPVILVLFAIGDGARHTWADRVAVGCVIVQCLCVLAALRDATVDTVRSPVVAA
ncbi:MAG: hypothetical protein ACREOU_09560 [Candidatus Eiseniibacteriota bacterium]